MTRKAFVNVNRSGWKRRTAHFTVLAARNGLDRSRLGITASRKIGGAVVRNRVKRRVREVFRLHKTSFPKGCDIVIRAERNAGDLNFRQVREELLERVSHSTLC